MLEMLDKVVNCECPAVIAMSITCMEVANAAIIFGILRGEKDGPAKDTVLI
tara:strand:+ start:190 stop:342 length:153 start_codon:yes stop_codon:yes gene_type:complete